MTPARGIDLFEDGVWQMSLGERAAIEGVLSALRPALAIEIGTAEGASVRRIARHAAEVHSFDLVEPSLPGLGAHVHLHTGDSHVLLPTVLEQLAAAGRNVDFVLVDGDHSSLGVREDMESLLASPAVGSTIIIAHDTGNEQVRAGLDAVPYDAWPKVAHVDLDFVPGHLGRERFPGELWYGLGLVVVAADRQAYGSRSVLQADRHHAGQLLAIARDVLAEAPAPESLADPWTRQLEEEVVALRARVGREEEELVALRARVGELEGAVVHHRTVVKDVTTSASWRATALLRAAKHTVSRLPDRLARRQPPEARNPLEPARAGETPLTTHPEPPEPGPDLVAGAPAASPDHHALDAPNRSSGDRGGA